jgi:hypothetical protein
LTLPSLIMRLPLPLKNSISNSTHPSGGFSFKPPTYPP